jgi:type I restriction enzyme S subunit
MPSTPAPKGWKWEALTTLARLESGHTPSRKHRDYWGGAIPWISLQDARDNHGGRIDDTLEHTNDLGIANSSARVLPENTVCLSRTASVGYVVVMGRPMATSQDFVNWVCSEQLDPNFLKYIFVAEGKNLLRFASGAVHQTIYFPEVKAFHIACPPLREQRRLVSVLDKALVGIATARSNAGRAIQNVRAAMESCLDGAFGRRGAGLIDRSLGDVAIVDWGNTDLTKSSYVANGRFLAVSAAGCDGRIDHMEHSKHTPVISAIGAQCGRVFLPEEDFTAIKNTITLTPRAGVCTGRFLYRLLTHVELPRRGAAQPFISKGDIQAFRVAIPASLSVQDEIVERLDALETEMQRLESIYRAKLTALDELEASLLREAFSGRLRESR